MIYEYKSVNRKKRRQKPMRCIGNGKDLHPTNYLQLIWMPGYKKPRVIKHYG